MSEEDPVVAEAERHVRRRARRKVILHSICAIAGVLTVAALVRSVGPARLLGILAGSARWVPLLVGLEAMRIALEVVITWTLSASVRAKVPLGELTRVHVVGYAIASVMPAGRAACEAVKAAMLSRTVGLPEAAAIGAGNQGVALLGGALIGLVCLSASLARTGLSALTGALGVVTLVGSVAFVAFQLACRRPEVGGFLVRRFARMGPTTAAFQDAIRAIPILPPAAALASLLGRGVQSIQFGVVLHGIGASTGIGAALLAQGISIVGGSVGELMPAQLGATDGAFALAAPALGIAVADGVAISVLLHCVQLFWGAFGATTPLWWGRRRAGEAG